MYISKLVTRGKIRERKSVQQGPVKYMSAFRLFTENQNCLETVFPYKKIRK